MLGCLPKFGKICRLNLSAMQAQQLRLEPGSVAKVLRLTRLAPDIVQAIVHGRWPRHHNLHALRGRQMEVPLGWREQRVVFGMD